MKLEKTEKILFFSFFFLNLIIKKNVYFYRTHNCKRFKYTVSYCGLLCVGRA